MNKSKTKTTTDLVPKPTKIPYMNFFQAFRHTYKGPPKKATEMAKMAGAAWRTMSAEEKGPFVEMATVASKALSRVKKLPVTFRANRRRFGKVKRLQRDRLFSRSSGSSGSW